MNSAELSFAVLRLSVGAVFLWFGLDKIFAPEAWLGWVPDIVWSVNPMSPGQLMIFLGLAEAMTGLLLVAGRHLQFASIAATVIMTTVTLAVGINHVAVRDVGLLGCTLALLIQVDEKAERKIGRKRLAAAASLYIIFVLAMGALFLRA